MSEFPCKSVPSTNETRIKELEDSRHLLNGVKRAVVVLTRLPEYKISALRPPTPQQFYSEDDSLSSSDSDMQWEPEDDSSGSESSLLSHKKKTAQHIAAPHRTNNNNNNNITTNASKPAPVIISSVPAHCSSATTAIQPNLPEEELKVDTVVLARKSSMTWQRGKILEIVTREDGRMKYKVGFDERGKSLVSGHHVAFDTTPKLVQLYVGARVAVRCEDDMLRFRPGILAELPCRKNRLRFLVFLDCHLSLYVGLPSIHLCAAPLENVLDDVPYSPHKIFLTRYLKDWPTPLLSHFKPGQSLNVELNGAQQRCEVQSIDCSLMQVLFQDNQHKEWIYRGSIRLESIARFLESERAPK